MATILSTAQRGFLRILIGLALFVLANSAYLFLADPGPGLPLFYQLMLIAHLLGGALLLVLATIFVLWHLPRARRLWHPRAVSSGVGLTLAAYLLFATGLFIIYEANSREHAWILVAHQILALLAPAIYAVHRLVSHFRPRLRHALSGTAAFVACLVAMVIVHGETLPDPEPPRQTAGRPADPFLPFVPTNYPPESAPFFPSLATTSSGGAIDPEIVTRGELGDPDRLRADIERFGFGASTSVGAETCRRCHADTVAQWEASAHRFASFNNPFYRAAVEKLRDTEAGVVRSQWCAGCHDPALLFPGEMKGNFDPLGPEAQAGLTCLACHAIDSIHGQDGNGNYNLNDLEPSPYLFDSSTGGWRRFLADQLLKAKPRAHKRMLLRPVLRRPEFCMSCHKVSLDVAVNDYRYIRGQDEYDNWHDSGVSQNAARTFYLPKKPRACRDCHMPLEPAPLGDVAAKNGQVRSHRFLAVNTALPHLRGDRETVGRIERFLRDGKLRVDLFAMAYADGKLVRALDRSRPHLVPGEEVVFEVVVRNRGVGHTFPGGTTDSNEAWIDFRITGEDGGTIFRSGAVDREGRVDPRAHFYRAVWVRHDGTVGNERDAWNFHAPAFSRVIGPGLADVARYAVRVPAGAAGQRLRIEARLMWRKFNRDYSDFVGRRLGRTVPELPRTVVATDAVALDVRARRGGAPEPADPELWERYNDHGIASLLQGAFDVAEESWEAVRRLQPGRPDGPRNLARRWIASATPERAEPFLREMDEVAPLDPQRPWFWGRYYERIEEYEQAEAAYRHSLEVFPSDRGGWRRLGAVRFKLHRYEDSLAAYLKALEIDPEDREAHKRRLDLYRLLGREEDAAEAQRAFQKYKLDDQAQEVVRGFLLRHPEINEEAQRRHLHR
ncbi:MAG: tetratricopeptide repeat protein [Planctomycetota bacterium]